MNLCFVNSKFVSTFEVLLESYCYEAITSKTTGTNKRRRHTGASPEVLSLLRNDSSSSDRLSLFISKSIIMLLENGLCSNAALEVIEQFNNLECNQVHKKNLRELFTSWVVSDQTTGRHRESITDTFLALDDLLSNLESCRL